PDNRIWYLTDKDFGYFEIDENLLNRNFKKVSLPKLADEFVKGFEELHFIDNNDIMIPTESGVIQVINPGKQKPLTPEALLSKVKIINHKDSIIYGGFINDNISKEDGPSEIILPYNQNYLRFEYFNSTFSSSDDVYYNPYIEGIDENDDSWTQETYKDYSRLPHGSYTFTISSKNKYGDIGQVSQFSFTIKPPWYESILFNVIYLLVAFLILAGLILIPRSKYRRKVRDLENVQEKSKDEIDQLKNEKLKAELEFKDKQLASSMMHIVQKNEVLSKVKEEAKILKKYIKDPKAEKELRKLISILSNDERLDEDWEKFTFYFDQVHTDFLKRLKYEHPVLSPKDQKLCAYLRMNLTTKEIAPLLNISVRGVEISRYRLRKKLQLDPSTNLNEFMMHY
ncbi:MAG: hypothetical protein HKO89_08955, partial [Saprospiraceae bacterium]|nr:hypothetical protein [Saprospiraceae bacterium]